MVQVAEAIAHVEESLHQSLNLDRVSRHEIGWLGLIKGMNDGDHAVICWELNKSVIDGGECGQEIGTMA